MTNYRFRCMGPFFFETMRSRRHRVNRFMVFDPDAATNQVFEQAEAVQGRIRTGGIAIDDISRACGLYVIGLKSRDTLIPYYVGKAARQTIKARLFQKQDKPAKINAILNEIYGAKPFVFLFPLVTATGRLVKPAVTARRGTSTTEKVIDDAEYMMIGHAMSANPWLHNISTVIAREKFSIDGSPGMSRTETDFAKRYRTMMGWSEPTLLEQEMERAADVVEEKEDYFEEAAKEALAHPDELDVDVSAEEAGKLSRGEAKDPAD